MNSTSKMGKIAETTSKDSDLSTEESIVIEAVSTVEGVQLESSTPNNSSELPDSKKVNKKDVKEKPIVEEDAVKMGQAVTQEPEEIYNSTANLNRVLQKEEAAAVHKGVLEATGSPLNVTKEKARYGNDTMHISSTIIPFEDITAKWEKEVTTTNSTTTKRESIVLQPTKSMRQVVRNIEDPVMSSSSRTFEHSYLWATNLLLLVGFITFLCPMLLSFIRPKGSSSRKRAGKKI